jgi:mono/diheme cytochrome c family protein
MKHSKTIAVVAAVFIVSLLIPGCGTSAPTPATPITPTSSSPSTPSTITPSSSGTATAPPAEASTAGQLADAGKAVYTESCAKCHGANGEGGGSPALTGSKANLGKYSTAQALLDFVSKQMPLSKPGSLSSQACIQVIAFLLVQNQIVQPMAKLDANSLDGVKLTK